MNYKLCKKLKDAGFPKNGFEYEEGITDVKVIPGVIIPGEASRWRNVPTLSELIEACGNDFSDLGRSGDAWFVNNEGGLFVEGHSDTPEEAVANLYLAIKSKSQQKHPD